MRDREVGGITVLMSEFKLEKHVYQIESDATADDIGMKVTMILSLPFAVDSISIAKGEIRAMVWEPDKEPPYGDIPDPPPDSLRDLLAKLELSDLNTSNLELSIDALTSMARMLIQARQESKAATAWVAGDVKAFCEWINVKPSPSRILDIPIFESNVIPEDKLILLCGKTAHSNPLMSDYGVLITMERQDAEV